LIFEKICRALPSELGSPRETECVEAIAQLVFDASHPLDAEAMQSVTRAFADRVRSDPSPFFLGFPHTEPCPACGSRMHFLLKHKSVSNRRYVSPDYFFNDYTIVRIVNHTCCTQCGHRDRSEETSQSSKTRPG
jgi:hypothetical protein